MVLLAGEEACLTGVGVSIDADKLSTEEEELHPCRRARSVDKKELSKYCSEVYAVQMNVLDKF